MAGDVTDPQAPAEPAAPARLEAAPTSGERSRLAPPTQGVYVGRFRLVYALLALLVGGAVGTFVVLSGQTGGGGGAAWSSWKPDGSPSDRLEEIASFVGRRYRIDSGKRQLVAVSYARPPSAGQLEVDLLVLSDGSNTEAGIDVMPAEDTVSYVLCGLGEGCSISSGPPTVERGRLLRREALELALYTFKYVEGIDSVVALLPPRPRSETRFALFFTRDDLEPALEAPLERTLPVQGDLTQKSLGAFETSVIEQYADDHVFQYSFGQAGDGRVFLALEPPTL